MAGFAPRSTRPYPGRKIVVAMGNLGAVDVKRFFEERLERHGDSPRSVDCSEEGQQGRFQLLAELERMSGRSVVDLGCGLGPFDVLLRDRYEGLSYTRCD